MSIKISKAQAEMLHMLADQPQYCASHYAPGHKLVSFGYATWGSRLLKQEADHLYITEAGRQFVGAAQ